MVRLNGLIESTIIMRFSKLSSQGTCSGFQFLIIILKVEVHARGFDDVCGSNIRSLYIICSGP